MIYGKDTFFMRSALNGATVEAGDQVQFGVAMGTKGPEAENIRVISAKAGQVYVGTIKQFTAEKGFGFINCDLTRNLYGKDIFLHNKELGGYTPSQGEDVQFAVAIAADGRPEAVNVAFPNGGYGSVSEGKATGKSQQRYW